MTPFRRMVELVLRRDLRRRGYNPYDTAPAYLDALRVTAGQAWLGGVIVRY